MRITSFTTLLFAFSISLYAQSGNINNTLGSGGAFTIKDASKTFLTVSKSGLYLPDTSNTAVGYSSLTSVFFAGRLPITLLHNGWAW